MSDNQWFEKLREAFIADQASLFLVHGPGASDRVPTAAVSRLSETREVVGVMNLPAGLLFPGLGDVGRFERLLSGRDLFEGSFVPLSDREPREAVARIWRALGDKQLPQAYILGPIEQLCPNSPRPPTPLPASTPELAQWAQAERLRASNHVVVLYTEQLDAVDPGLRAASFVIALDSLAVEAAAPAAPPPEPPAPSAPATDADLEQLASDLERALLAEIPRHDESLRPAGIPVMAAVAIVLNDKTGSPGSLTWSLDEHGQPLAEGQGASEFLDRWSSDIVLSACASTILKDWTPQDQTIHAAGLRALAKRVTRLL